MALIDDLNVATLGDAPGLHYVTDKYALRNVVRKAQCFTLNSETSALIADFSMAVAHDLDAARQLAVSPYPVTFFDLDNRARLTRTKELGAKLTNNAAFDPVDRVGWLIERHQSQHTAFRAMYVTMVGEGVILAPHAFAWDIEGYSCPWEHTESENVSAWLFGIHDAECQSAWFVPPPGIHDFPRKDQSHIKNLMRELIGELRHIFGLLIALGNATPKMGAPHTPGASLMVKGKPVFAIEHRTLVIHLRKNTTVKQVVTRAIIGVKKRGHDVRSHIRTYRNPDGTVKARAVIPSHRRGDDRLGIIEKTYEVRK